MADTDLNIDPALLAEFLDESSDMLAGLDTLFVDLEANPADLNPVQAIFRPVHSIKGNSAFFGFTHVKTLAHEMETLLDMVRKKTLAVSQALITVLLAGVDELKAALARARRGEPEVVDAAAFQNTVQRVKEAAASGVAAPATAVPKAIAMIEEVKGRLAEGQAPLREELDRAIGHLRALVPEEKTPPRAGGAVPAPVAEILEILATPFQGALSDQKCDTVGRCLEAIPQAVRGDQAKALTADLLDTYKTFVNSVGFDPLLAELLTEKLKALCALAPWEGVAEEAPASTQPTPGSVPEEKAPPKPQAEQHKTMRVPETYIDTFLTFVGELLVVGDMFNHIEKRIEGANEGESANYDVLTAFRRTNQTFATLSTDLQRSIMSIRRVALRGLLQKVPRLVRDVAAQSKKEIAVELDGESVEVDKSLIDLLDAPLTHMVRNAADHGIEPPAKREAAGKARQGVVRVIASETPDTVSLSVEDDGAGLNYERIKAKAESLGLIQPGQQLREADIVNLLFSSGVSTAETVTDISGRGVGMDVVKRTIEQSGGSIRVTSEPGKGSHFTVQLPKTVTTQIMAGFLVQVGGQCFVLPMEKVRETAKVAKDGIDTVIGKGRCVRLHGDIITVTSLREALGMAPADDAGQEFEVLVSVEAFKRVFALSVDAVLGVQQVVLREIKGISCDTEAMAGGALLGDGSVALIIDPEKLLDRRKGRT